MTQPNSESATRAPKRILSDGELTRHAGTSVVRPAPSPASKLREVAASLLEVPVLVEGGAGRREQDRVARPRRARGPRDRAGIAPQRSTGRRRLASAVSIVSAASPIVRTTRARWATSGASDAKSPCLSRPPRIRITLPSGKALEGLGRGVDVRSLGIVDPAEPPASATSSVRCGRPAKRVRASTIAPRASRAPRPRRPPRARSRGCAPRAGPAGPAASTSCRAPPTSETSMPASSHAPPCGAARGPPRREKRIRRAGVWSRAREGVVGVEDGEVLGASAARRAAPWLRRRRRSSGSGRGGRA